MMRPQEPYQHHRRGKAVEFCNICVCRTFISTKNTVAGTLSYMAPEMFEGGPVTESVDVSLLTTSKHVFKGCIEVHLLIGNMTAPREI